jgi:hypothetical protein
MDLKLDTDENILNKHERKAHRANLTIFRSNRTNDEILRLISVPYFPKIIKKLETNSNNYKIKNKVKDEINDNNKSGI